eukprot:CAMPEP_0117427296 /NCGR_PEP_ID=MMETSP0758-20121206/7174_1 /TAXON_ID=63605 /ORGANISM="Percolomonas cosmopolitus, Strain AE-1 (ATCC 50343)" /LENGTH=657 /DNA_ID=CAMNT_0005212851 /DNA_START=18 /DNA_END=1991 /DNA_ORIENTATION=+
MGAGTLKRRRKKKKEEKVQEEVPQNEFEINTTVVPAEDVLDLTEKELAEKHTRILKAQNPNAPQNISRFNYVERKYKFEASVPQTAFHFEDDGYMILKNGEEAEIMRERAERKRLAMEERKSNQVSKASGQDSDSDLDDSDESDVDDTEEDVLKNQFNFCSRATQTFTNVYKEQSTNTEPPPTMDFCATATQWEIYDAYIEMMAAQKRSLKKGKKKNESVETQLKPKKQDKNADTIMYSPPMAKTLRVMERMINQNTNEELLEDFKFWEDDSDQFKTMGTLLPLWRFTCDKGARKHVTGLSWNNYYSDLFAVSYGSYDFLKQGAGAVCCFSLKNPSYPEYQFSTSVGVTSIDFHPEHHSLLCAGLYNGSVAIYDIRQKGNSPLIQSSVHSGQHQDVVWQVLWDRHSSSSPSFTSVSGDGRVTNWKMAKNELQHNDLMQFYGTTSKSSKNGLLYNTMNLNLSVTQQQDAVDQLQEHIRSQSSCSCASFHPSQPQMYLAGTETGDIHRCSKAYNSQSLQVYHGHSMAVYATRWNSFADSMFLSASADWTVKLWDMNLSDPLMTFDLGAGVGDVTWAPYSATVFAAVTDDGKVHVYDLNVNKHDSLCEQLVVKKAKLTHIEMNPSEPVILVGDDKGLVQTLKLSPNLIRENDQMVEITPQ